MTMLELLAAASGNNRAVVTALVQTGLDQESLNQAFSCAIAYSHLELAEYLLVQGADLTWGDNESLRCAVSNGEVGGTQFCLSRGIDVNVENGMVLREAAMSMPHEFLIWLLERGADVNIAEGLALTNAIVFERLDNVQVLLAHGANPLLNHQQAVQEANSRVARGNPSTIDIQRLVNKAAQLFSS
jgi:ankyrin repeat protein